MTLISPLQTKIINTQKICKDCKYFRPTNSFDYHCKKFGETNLVTGIIYYEYAKDVRNNKEKCGNDAVYFEKNNFRFITDPFYFLYNNRIFIITGSIIGVYIGAYAKIILM